MSYKHILVSPPHCSLTYSEVVFIQSTLSNHYGLPQFHACLKYILPALNSMHRPTLKTTSLIVCVFYCTFVIHHLAKEISLIITLHIFYDTLVHWFYEGHHISRKVKNKNISRLQFKFMRVCIATIK